MKKNIKKVFLVLLVTNSSLFYSQNYYEDGVNEYFKGNDKHAIELFTKAIQNNQELAKSYMMRGAEEIIFKEYPQAVSDLNASIKLDSIYYKAYYYYGRLYLVQGFYKTAIKYYDKAVLRNGNDAGVFDDRAAAKALNGDYDGAIVDENKAISIDASNEESFVTRGFCKMQLRQFKEAIEDFNKSLKIKPIHKAYANRGYIYSELGEHSKAIEDYSMALKMIPEDKELYYRRGISYKFLGKMDLACSDFEKSAKLGYQLAISEKQKNCINLQKGKN